MTVLAIAEVGHVNRLYCSDVYSCAFRIEIKQMEG